MATILDALLVTLELDGSRFKRGADEAQGSLKDTEEQAARTAKEMEARGKQAAEFFNEIKTAAIGFAAVLATTVAGIAKLTTSFSGSDAALGRTAEQLGIGTEELSKWINMVKQVGGSAEEATSTMAALALGAQQFNQTGEASPLIKLLLSRGITPTGNAIELFEKLGASLRGLSKAAQTNLLTNAGLPPSVISLLESSPDVLRKIETAAQTNLVTPEQAKNAQELERNIAELEGQFLSFGRTVAAEVIPVVIPMLQDLNKWMADPGNRATFLDPIVNGIRELATWLKTLDWASFWKGASAAGGELLGVLSRVENAAGKVLDAIKAVENFKPPSWARIFLGIHQDPANPAADGVGSRIPIPGQVREPGTPGAPAEAPAAPDAPDTRPWWQRLYTPGPGLLDGVFGSNATPESDGTYKPIRDLLGESEKTDRGRGYNETLGYGKYTGGPVNLTSMTLDQVAQVQKTMLANGASSTAVGRYQFLQDTLKTLTGQLNLDPSKTKFTPEVQDRLADQDIKNRGGDRFRQGLMSAHDFIMGLAKEWASVADPDTGKSHYGQGVGVSMEQTLQALRQLVPSANARMAWNDNRSHTDARSTVETHIGTVTVHTQAKDAKGIANDIAPALRQGIAAQANTGLA